MSLALIDHVDPEPCVAVPCAADEQLLSDCLGGPPDGARDAAGALLARFGSLSGVLSASSEALAGTPGVGLRRARAVRTVHALSLRLLSVQLAGRPVISAWSALLAYARHSLRHQGREQFRVLFLDGRNGLIRDETLGHGSLNHAPVYPREVVRRALELDAASVILLHNHPSGDATPSSADIQMTRQVVEAARALGIAVHDHLIVARDEVASFRALGLLTGAGS